MNQIMVRHVVVLFLLITQHAFAEDATAKPVEDWQDATDEWIGSEEGQRIITNIISWQNENGGWYKSYNTLAPRPEKYAPQSHPLAPKEDNAEVWSKVSTIDNGATYTEVRLLARAYHLTQRKDALEAFDKGLQFLLGAQYPNGGFPQRFPLQNNYGRHITFNDAAMVNVLELIRDASQAKGDFDFVPADLQARCRESFDRGVDCILKCQIKQDGKLTAWAQQHDAETLAPASARSYELPAFSSTESAEIVLLLLKLDNPGDGVKAAIRGAVAWFESTKMLGKRYEKLTGPQYENGFERRLIDDPSAPPYWSRFYELDSNRPMFVDRDGSKHYDVSELGYERRAGYSWFSTKPNSVLKAFSKWDARYGSH